MHETERRQVVTAVEAAMKSFEAAERARDPERLTAHFAPVPGFHMYSDGQRITYEAMAAGIRQALPALRSIEGGFSDFHVMVLSPEHALVSAWLAPRSGKRLPMLDAEPQKPQSTLFGVITPIDPALRALRL